MTTLSSDFYRRQESRMDVLAECVLGFVAGALVGTVLGGVLAVAVWQAMVPLHAQIVSGDIAAWVSVCGALLCGTCGALVALARSGRA